MYRQNKIRKMLTSIGIATLIASLFVIVLMGMTNTAHAEEALEIMKKSDERYVGDTFTRDMTMILIDKNNNKRTRKLRLTGKNSASVDKTLSVFLSPADVKNTTFMSFDWSDPSKEDNSWLYLPSLRKVKRVPASDKSGAFLGSDFTYSDIEGVEVSRYDYKILKPSVTINGAECWLIERTPKNKLRKQIIKETGYSKTNLWVRKDNYMVVQSKGWFKSNKIKYFKISEIKTIANIDTEIKMQMITTKGRKVLHKTLLLTDNNIYNLAVDDQVFTTRAMGK